MCSYALDEPSCRQALLCCDRTKFSSARSASGWLLERSVRAPCRIFESTCFSGSTRCSLKRKRIAISRDSILRSPFSCVLTKLTQPPVNSLSGGRRTRGIRCTAGRLCTTKFVKSHRPSVYSTICELLGGKFKLQARVVSPENPVLYCCVLEHSRGSPHSSLGSWLSLGLLRFRR